MATLQLFRILRPLILRLNEIDWDSTVMVLQGLGNNKIACILPRSKEPYHFHKFHIFLSLDSF